MPRNEPLDPGDPSVLDSPASGGLALRGGTIRAAGYALGMLLSVVSAPVLVHHLGVDGFGRYTTVTVLVALIGTGTEAGLTAIALREYTTAPGAGRSLAMRHLLGIRLTLTAVGVLLAMLFALAAGYEDVRVIGVLVAGGGLMMTMVQSLLVVPLQAQLRLGQVTALVLLRQVVSVAAIIGLALAGASLGPFFAVPVLAGAITLVATIAVVRSAMPLRPTVSPRAWGALLGQTLTYAVATAIYAAYFRVAVILTSLRASDIETGVFATSYRVIEVVLTIPGILVTAAFPILARAEHRDRVRFERATVRLVELALLAGAATALGLTLAAPLIIDVLTPAEGEPATAVLRLQAPAMIATFVAVACGYPLLALHRQRAILAANAIAFAAVFVLVLVLLGGRHPAQGAAVATTMLALLGREIPALARIARLLPALALACAAGLAPLALPGASPAVDTALGLAAFTAVLALTRRLPPELGHLLSRAR
jgi:O-antigen/teichoic acid export membrane protein